MIRNSMRGAGVVLALVLAVGPQVRAAGADKDIVETAQAAGAFKTLLTAATEAGLVETLFRDLVRGQLRGLSL